MSRQCPFLLLRSAARPFIHRKGIVKIVKIIIKTVLLLFKYQHVAYTAVTFSLCYAARSGPRTANETRSTVPHLAFVYDSLLSKQDGLQRILSYSSTIMKSSTLNKCQPLLGLNSMLQIHPKYCQTIPLPATHIHTPLQLSCIESAIVLDQNSQ